MNLNKFDAITRKEIEFFVERKEDEHGKICGQIARDLRRVGGEYGFLDERNYRLLRDKYLRGHQSKKKLFILDLMKNEWCRND